MITRAQRIRLGIFVLVAVLIIVVGIGVVVAPQFLEKRDKYKIAFENVSVTGLQEGSAVKYHGVQVGFVSGISIDKQNIQRVIVEVSLEEGIPVKEDSRAEITMLGITGLKVIEIRGGSNQASRLAPGSYIETGPSATEKITGRAEALAAQTEVILNNISEMTREENVERILALSDNASEAISYLNDFIRQNKGALNSTIENTQRFSGNLDSLTLHTKSILASIDKFAKSDTLHQIVENVANITSALEQAELVRLFQEINTTLEQTNNMLRDVEISFSKSRTDLVYTIERLKESVDYLNQFSRMISENPSVLIRGVEVKNAPDFNLEN